MAGRSVTAPRLVDDRGTELLRQLTGPVARPVVDNDRPGGGGHPAQHPRQRGCLVEARQHNVDEALHTVDGKRQPPAVAALC
jgi:hypothetical protein